MDQIDIMNPKFQFKAPMTLEERGAMEKFKDALDDDDNSDYDSDIHSDNLLIRFLRARKLDIAKASLMFNEYLKFRVEYKVDTIIKVIFFLINLRVLFLLREKNYLSYFQQVIMGSTK